MQEIIVAVVVACACWVTLRRYLPLPVRSAIAQRAADLCLRFGWVALATRLQASKATASAATACGGCNDCSHGGSPPSPQIKGSITPDALRKTIRR